MRSTMMPVQLGVGMILRHGRDQFPRSVVATYDGRDVHERTFADVAARAERLAGALQGLGIRAGDRVATFCWNSVEHLEAYLAVPASGAILHTLNVRFFAEQVAWVINHADDRAVIVDAVLLPLLAPVLAQCPGVAHVIVVGEPEAAAVPGRALLDYERLLAAAPARYDWPEVDEYAAAAACYTSGTTGHPKGVVYSHRSTFLHALAVRAVDTFGVCERDRILVLPAMFHANAWGLPYAGWMSGSDLIMPRQFVQAAHIARLVAGQRATLTATVPTLLNDLLQLHEHTPIDLSSLRMLLSGGSAIPPSMIARLRGLWGVPVLQGWGMTETSPMCAVSHPPRAAAPEDEVRYRATQGRAVPGVELRVVGEDGGELPQDGATVGEVQVRGPWITGRYHDNPAPESFAADGWLRTGDIGTLDAEGYVTLKDRSKDVIKSGGEWISSVELEGRLIAHPDVIEAAVIGVPDERWQERPLAFVRLRDERPPDAGALRAFLEPQVARFWLPERWAFVEAIPKTSVGKIDKKALRALHAEGALVVQRTAAPGERG